MTGSLTNQTCQQPVDLNTVLASLTAVVQRLDQQDAANKATQERLDVIAAASLPSTQPNDHDPDTAKQRLFKTIVRDQTTDQTTNEELLRLQGTIKDMSSRIHQAMSFAPEIDRVLEATQKLRSPFNITMGRAYFTTEEREASYCQLFIESLAEPALTWFSLLSANSISTFKELSTKFLKHYSMYIRQGASETDLWKISQGQKESLQDFMERFKNLVSKVDVPYKTAVEARRNALWIRSSFRSDLYTNSTITLEDALHRANCFIRMEKDNTAYTEPRQHQPNEKKGKVYSATEEPDDQDTAAPPRHRDDTATEDERPQVGRRINLILMHPLTSSSSENSSDRDLRDRLPHKRSATDLRDTNLRSKKPNLSDNDLCQKLTPKREGETPITFSENDLTDTYQSHNDPLLVELQIDTCEVTRFLIDTGSSIDLIFRQTLIKMMVDLKDIKPSSRALTGFNGSSTQLLGTIRLNIFVRGVSKLVKFSVIDTKTQYNAIMGMPWIHMMKAVPSTYHQCVKFPTREGTIFTLKGNQRLAQNMLISDFKNKQVAFAIEPEKKLSPQKEETIQVGIDA
ncbi:hypothetical protein N665_0070s0036 [Sinapis alba]|nr:hypothetical protein N665_0070s0036 [Sinapis alba]